MEGLLKRPFNITLALQWLALLLRGLCAISKEQHQGPSWGVEQVLVHSSMPSFRVITFQSALCRPGTSTTEESGLTTTQTRLLSSGSGLLCRDSLGYGPRQQTTSAGAASFAAGRKTHTAYIRGVNDNLACKTCSLQDVCAACKRMLSMVLSQLWPDSTCLNPVSH